MDLRPEKYIRSLGVGEPVKQEFSWMQYVVDQSAAPKKFVLFFFIHELYQNRRLELDITAAYKRQQGSQIK